ncbi:MAG: hypothetical protein HMLKMBBP_03336 [Planctomycetes bacterium]|nr:hypothetical protein [Planctomycetota bacterium]
MDGLLPASHADRGRGLSAALLAAERDLGRRTISERDAVLAAGERIARGTDPRGIAGGVDILRSAGRDVRRELVAAVGRQAADGAFREARVSDVEATSAGVLALRRAWRR